MGAIIVIVIFLVKILIKIAGLIILGVGIYMIPSTWKKYQRAQEVPNWPTTEGLITTSKVAVDTQTHYSDAIDLETGHRGYSETYSFRPFVEYEYTIDNELYTSKRMNIWEITDSYSDRKKLQQYLAKFPQGEKTTVWYDPEDPTISVIDTDFKDGLKKAVKTMVVMIVLGLLMMVIP